MSHVPHELVDEFPDHAERIHALKMADRRFARLAEDYREVNRAIHRLETRIEPSSEEREAELRRRRLALKDEIAHALQVSAAQARA